MNRAQCLEVLASFGVEGEVEKLMHLRPMIEQLKRQSHLDGSCECPAASYIRSTLQNP